MHRLAEILTNRFSGLRCWPLHVRCRRKECHVGSIISWWVLVDRWLL